jgi:hypothetical protein
MKSTIEWLSFASFATVDRVETEEGWTSYALRPGPYAHNLFAEGEAPSDAPAFERMTLAAGDTERLVALSEEEVAVYFYVEFVGCCFERPLDELADRLHQIMAVRTERFSVLGG